MAKKKPKPVYSVTTYDDATPAAVYSCLRTLCDQWGILGHYTTVWKALNRGDLYVDGKITVKKHILVRAEYIQGGTRPSIPVQITN